MTIKVGDRVKVEFEGEVAEAVGGVYLVADGLSTNWFHPSALTVIPKPIILPTKRNALIELEGDIWLQKEVGDWLDPYGASSWLSTAIDLHLSMRPQANYRVIFEGEDDRISSCFIRSLRSPIKG